MPVDRSKTHLIGTAVKLPSKAEPKNRLQSVEADCAKSAATGTANVRFGCDRYHGAMMQPKDPARDLALDF
jgi:hypothetical protein